jgi:hypothetical protein
VEAASQPASTRAPSEVVEVIPKVLRGDTWLRHHREDLMPYWEMPEALGVPVGNFPSFRGRSGELLPESSNRGLSTLARGVYGYSLAYLLTGEGRYLTYAKAGLDWINAKAKDPVYGGYYGELDLNGNPVDPQADKDLFDLASLGLAYGMYFTVTRDPLAEADLLAVRDLIFTRYYDAATDEFSDSLTYDLATEVDTADNGGDITNLLVPGTALLLPTAALLTDPKRRAQFRSDLRTVTNNLIANHKNRTGANRWWFWGRTERFGGFNAQQTDFGHNIKSYAMIHNANKIFADHPWEALATDRTTMLGRAWDDPVARWNQRLRSFMPGNVEPDSAWWVHNEADQLLAALNLSNGFVHNAQLARSAQSWLDVYVDRDPAYPVRETFVRVERTGLMTDLRKSTFGKNMLHTHEHALIMYLHGRALEGKPARLYFAFPQSQALTAVAKPYWFAARGEVRRVLGDVAGLPGHRTVAVDFTGIDGVLAQPYPPPDDNTAPTSVIALTPSPNRAGTYPIDVQVSLQATDDMVGVKEIHVQVLAIHAATPSVVFIDPGGSFTLPAFTAPGVYRITYFAVDRLDNTESPRRLMVTIL